MAWVSERVFFGLAYLLLAAAMLTTARSVPQLGARRAAVWFGLASLACVAATLRLTGGGDAVSDVFRERARSSGWYADRGVVQVFAVIGLITVVVALVATTVLFQRRRSVRVVPTLVYIGVCGSVLVAAVRIVSLHQVDTFVAKRIIGVRVLAILEFAAVSTTFVGVWRAHREPTVSRVRR